MIPLASHYQKSSSGTLLQVEFQCVVTVKLCCGSVKIPLRSVSQEESASHSQCQLLPCYFCELDCTMVCPTHQGDTLICQVDQLNM